jgi:hypothetical protein
LFTAAENGDWGSVSDSLAAMHKSAREAQSGSSKSKSQVVYPVEWAVINEIGAALEEFATREEKYAIAFARDIIASVPPGSIYFGGTDSGRFLVTALSRSHPNAEPFFTLTQNALAEQERLLKEADFAFRQAFVLCPASPVAVFRYTNLLLGQKRLDEAILVADAAVKLEGAAKPGPEPPAHIQEHFSHKPIVESRTSPPTSSSLSLAACWSNSRR